MTLPVVLAWVLGALLIGVGVLAGVLMVRRSASILSPDGRRAWAFAAICGGCGVFTLFAAVGVWLVSDNALYTLILALAAHLQVFVGMTALGWTLGRRLQLDVSRDGAKLNDQEAPLGTTATVTATVQTAPPVVAVAKPSESEAD